MGYRYKRRRTAKEMGELVGINIAGLKYCCPLARARLMIPSPVENAHSHKDYGKEFALKHLERMQ